MAGTKADQPEFGATLGFGRYSMFVAPILAMEPMSTSRCDPAGRVGASKVGSAAKIGASSPFSGRIPVEPAMDYSYDRHPIESFTQPCGSDADCCLDCVIAVVVVNHSASEALVVLSIC